MLKSKLARWTTSALLAVSLTGAACARSGGTAGTAVVPTPATGDHAMTTAGDTVSAADLRARLTALMTEHVHLASAATGAALRGDTAAFEAYAAALNGPTGSNTADLVAAVSGVYGTEVGTAFDGLWRAEGHIPAVVAYTQAVGTGDTAAADKAVNDLLGYARTFGSTMAQVNEHLPAAAVEEAVVGHITTLKAVIDAQKANDAARTYAALREAAAHMAHTASVLADATAKKFPGAVDGSATSAASELRAGLTSLLGEHVFLAAAATGSALRGDTTGFEGAATALNGPSRSNTADLVNVIGSVYGDEVGAAFNGLWRSTGHIPAFVTYTQAVATGDEAAAGRAVEDLVGYAKSFGTTMNQVNPNLPAGDVESAVAMHATTLKVVVDAQKSGDRSGEASALRTAAGHMAGTAKVLSNATVLRFPDRF